MDCFRVVKSAVGSTDIEIGYRSQLKTAQMLAIEHIKEQQPQHQLKGVSGTTVYKACNVSWSADGLTCTYFIEDKPWHIQLRPIKIEY